MTKISLGDYVIRLDVKGSDRYEKVSFPIRYGCFSEIETNDFIFQFNLNGEIKYIRGKNTFQIEPTEWLKRTQANDWVFYSSGGYNGAIRTIGEHYVPCFQYQTNAVTGGNPFKQGFFESAVSALYDLLMQLNALSPEIMDEQLSAFVRAVVSNDDKQLAGRTEYFHSITDGPISVLPPDTRHVDYDVVPVTIATGCLYNCAFCSVKTGSKFSRKSKEAIRRQINLLKDFYSKEIYNVNALFLGQHDALFAGAELIEYAALTGYDRFNFDASNLTQPRLFLFGSADSLLSTSAEDLERINRLPFDTFVNIGFESFDSRTLSMLGKPVSAEKMLRAFERMLEINKRYPRIEITANLVIGDGLPDSHYRAFKEQVAKIPVGSSGKGMIYISPFENSFDRKRMLRTFKEMKSQCRIPAFLYLIQRL